MSRRVRQAAKNLAKEMFATGQTLSVFAQSLVQTDVQELTVGELKELEDKLFGSLLLIRAHRQAMSATVIHEKGQRA